MSIDNKHIEDFISNAGDLARDSGGKIRLDLNSAIAGSLSQAESEKADMMVDALQEFVGITGNDFKVTIPGAGEILTKKEGGEVKSSIDGKDVSKKEFSKFINNHGIMDRVKSEFGNYIIKEIEKAPENTKHTLESIAGKAGGLLQKAIGTMGR